MVVAELVEALFDLELIIAAFGGGAFGAALGALPAFIFTGFMVIAGESAVLANTDAGSITGNVAFGPPFSPAISFAGGAAAAAYAARRGYIDTGFDYHEAKNIAYALGTKPDVLAVGGAFGIIGYWFQTTFATIGMPWDPIAMGVVLSALFHRLILGYSIIGKVRGSSVFDMTPFEREEKRAITDGGEVQTADAARAVGTRLAVEPWLPHQYKWGHVAMIGLVAGLLGGYTALATGSPFLAFGISVASLLFLNCGVEKIPVTHHMTLPASTAALAVVASGDAVFAGMGNEFALLIAALFGIICALFGEVFQRIFYAHGDTHWDPPAAAIVFGTILIAILYFAGIFPDTVWVPTF